MHGVGFILELKETKNSEILDRRVDHGSSTARQSPCRFFLGPERDRPSAPQIHRQREARSVGRSRLSQHDGKALLREMIIMRQDFGDAVLPHGAHRNAVGQKDGMKRMVNGL